MERAKLVQELQWRQCAGNGPQDYEACIYWCETFVKIRHPEKGRIPFVLRPAQKETLQQWLTERYNLVLKARQIGYSTLAAAMALWLTFFHNDKYIIMLSRTEREAEKLFAKAGYALKFLPNWMKDRGPKIVQQTLRKLLFDNESQIEALPSTQDPARGETAYGVVVDEWAFLENPEEAWSSIEPVADVGGRIWGLSTAHGSGDFFHTLWVRAVEGKNRFKWLFYPWSANTDRDQTWYEHKAEDFAMTPWVLHQEYPRNPEEAFIKSGRSVFDVEQLDKQELMQPRIGDLWAKAEHSRYAEFHETPEGELRLYEPPVPGCVYVIGADVAEGLDHGDYSCAVVLDALTSAVCAVWHGHVDPDVFADVCWRLGHWYGGALLGVEANNHGLATLLQLKRLRYPKLYYQVSIDQANRKKSRRLGWHTLINTKPVIIDGLLRALRGFKQIDEDGNIFWGGQMAVRDEGIVRELKTYVREPDGKKMHGSPHDDRVMALAIAQEMVQHARAPEHDSGELEEFWTLKWWEDEMHRAENTQQNWVIGA